MNNTTDSIIKLFITFFLIILFIVLLIVISGHLQKIVINSNQNNYLYLYIAIGIIVFIIVFIIVSTYIIYCDYKNQQKSELDFKYKIFQETIFLIQNKRNEEDNEYNNLKKEITELKSEINKACNNIQEILTNNNKNSTDASQKINK